MVNISRFKFKHFCSHKIIRYNAFFVEIIRFHFCIRINDSCFNIINVICFLIFVCNTSIIDIVQSNCFKHRKLFIITKIRLFKIKHFHDSQLIKFNAFVTEINRFNSSISIKQTNFITLDVTRSITFIFITFISDIFQSYCFKQKKLIIVAKISRFKFKHFHRHKIIRFNVFPIEIIRFHFRIRIKNSCFNTINVTCSLIFICNTSIIDIFQSNCFKHRKLIIITKISHFKIKHFHGRKFIKFNAFAIEIIRFNFSINIK